MYLQIEKYTKIIRNEIVLDEVSMELDKGKIYGLRGKNGSGKTMLLRAVCGLIHPTSGQVLIDGEIIGKDISFPRSIGALIENPGFIPNYSGFQNLRLLGDIKGIVTDTQIEEVLQKVGLDPKDKKKFKKYSIGMKQKLGIAAAVMESPELIILDEPTNALDEDTVKKVRSLLYDYQKQGSLIIVASHDFEELKALTDVIFVIEKGRIKEQIERDEE